MSEPQVEHILEVGMGFWASKTLLSAVELGVFTKLAEGPADLQTLTEALGMHSRSARDFLDALVALGFLERGGGTYRNTPSTDFFLDRQKPSYIGGILEMANLRLYPCWGSLTTALRTGQHQSESKGEQDAFATLYADPQRLTGFLKAMTGISKGANRAIAANFPWKDYKVGRRSGHCAGRSGDAGGARQSASFRHRLRSSPGRPDFPGIHGRQWRFLPGLVLCGEFFR